MMSKKSIALAITAGLVLFLLLIIRQLPANLVLAHAANNTRLFIPVQVSGTIWQGQAANMIIQQRGFRVALGEVQWQLSPWSLLLGRADISLQAENAEQKISGEFSLGFDQSLSAEDVELAVDAGLFRSLLPMPVKYNAFIELNLQAIDVEELLSPAPKIETLAGNLVVKDLAVNFGTQVELGSYGLRLGLADKQVEGERIISVNVSDIDANVEVSGNASALISSKSYFVDLDLKPKADANVLIKNTLSQFYKQQANGSFRISMGSPL